jgi:reactive intermediate/imine deaminase
MRRLPSRLAALATLAASAAAASCAGRASATRTIQHFGPDVAGRVDTTRPFTDVVRGGDFLFVSGKLGTDAEGRLVPGGIVPETRQLMQNIQRAGSSMDRVVKCTVFLVDLREWPTMNQVYVTFFPGNRPARSAVGVKELLFGARVEIECIALAP